MPPQINNPWFGYNREKQVLVKILRNVVDQSQAMLLFGPPKNGKSALALYCQKMAPGAILSFISCNVEANAKTLSLSCSRIQNLMHQVPIRSGVRLIVFLDEVDTVAVRRDASTRHLTFHCQSLMGLIDVAKEDPGIFLILCTNCPDILDNAITSRCLEALYLSYPTEEVLQEALIYCGYTPQKGSAVAKRWICLMSERGWWTGSQIVPVILSNARSIQRFTVTKIAEQLDRLVPGLRVNDFIQYELDNWPAIEASRRTLERFGVNPRVHHNLHCV